MVNGVEEAGIMLQLIEKYGTTSFVMVICIIALYLISKYFIKKFDELENKNNELIEKILEKSKEKEHKLEDDINRSQQINDILFEIKNELNCKQIKLSQLHNGVYSLSGCPFIKYSTTHRTSHSPYDISILNTPISLNCLWFELLSDKKMIYINNNINVDNKYLVSLLNSRACQMIISIKIYDMNCNIVALVDIEYDEIKEFEYEKIKENCQKLGYLN